MRFKTYFSCKVADLGRGEFSVIGDAEAEEMARTIPGFRGFLFAVFGSASRRAMPEIVFKFDTEAEAELRLAELEADTARKTGRVH